VIGKAVNEFYYYETDRWEILKLFRLKTKNNQLKYASVNARLVPDEKKQELSDANELLEDLLKWAKA
jgi:hypothetical protein